MRPKIVNCHCGYKGEKLINGIIQVIGSRESAAIRWQHSTKKSNWVKRYKTSAERQSDNRDVLAILWQPTVSARIGLQQNYEAKILCRGNRLGIRRSHRWNVPPTTDHKVTFWSKTFLLASKVRFGDARKVHFIDTHPRPDDVGTELESKLTSNLVCAVFS